MLKAPARSFKIKTYKQNYKNNLYFKNGKYK